MLASRGLFRARCLASRRSLSPARRFREIKDVDFYSGAAGFAPARRGSAARDPGASPSATRRARLEP